MKEGNINIKIQPRKLKLVTSDPILSKGGNLHFIKNYVLCGLWWIVPYSRLYLSPYFSFKDDKNWVWILLRACKFSWVHLNICTETTRISCKSAPPLQIETCWKFTTQTRAPLLPFRGHGGMKSFILTTIQY